MIINVPFTTVYVPALPEFTNKIRAVAAQLLIHAQVNSPAEYGTAVRMVRNVIL